MKKTLALSVMIMSISACDTSTLPPPPSSSELLINGGFEENESGSMGFTIFTDTDPNYLNGWTAIGANPGNTLTLFEFNWDFWGSGLVVTTGQYIGFNSSNGPFGDALEQTFATSVGDVIEVSYLVGNGSFNPLESALRLDVTSAGGTLGDLASQVSTHGSVNGFTQFTAQFTATTSTTTIRFTDVSTGDTNGSDTLLDEVSATVIP